MSLLNRLAGRRENGLGGGTRERRAGRVGLGIEYLEDRIAPAIFQTFDTITSPDGKHTAAVGQIVPVAPSTGQSAIYVVLEDGQQVSPEAYSNVFNLQFSPNSWHLAYDASVPSQGFVVVDVSQGQADLNLNPRFPPAVDASAGTFNNIVGAPQISSDSTKLTFTVPIGNGSAVQQQTLLLTNPTSIALSGPTGTSTYTATVTTLPGTPTPKNGLVQFFVDGKSAGFASLNQNGQATFTINNLSSGQHSITAKYLGTGLGGYYASELSNGQSQTGTGSSLKDQVATDVFNMVKGLEVGNFGFFFSNLNDLESVISSAPAGQRLQLILAAVSDFFTDL